MVFLLHLIVWKSHLPKRQTRTLLSIFLGTFAAGLFRLRSAKFIVYVSFPVPETFPEYLHIALFGIALTLA